MIKNLGKLIPQINEKGYVNEFAYVVGEVVLGEFSSIWPGAVVRADNGKISIGKRTNIQDYSVVHSDYGSTIGDDVTIGHCVVIHSKKIGNNTPICIGKEKDFYKRTLAECFVKGESLSKFLVRSGYAFAYRKYSTKFVEDEDFAKTNKLGMWSMTFKYPWDFRKGL